MKVSSQAKVPSKWNDFLRDPKKKEELFHFLSDEVDKAEWQDSNEIGNLHHKEYVHYCQGKRTVIDGMHT